MVNNINPSNSHALTDLQSAALEQAQQLQGPQSRQAQEAAKKAGLTDRMDISEEALTLANRDKDVMKYARMLTRQPEDVDTEKVSTFKSMLDSGRINDCLRRLGEDTLANDLLKSPAAAMLV